MKTRDAIRHYGTQTKLARALGITQPSIASWGEIVPPLRQLQIERVTEGALRAAPDVFENRFRRDDTAPAGA